MGEDDDEDFRDLERGVSNVHLFHVLVQLNYDNVCTIIFFALQSSLASFIYSTPSVICPYLIVPTSDYGTVSQGLETSRKSSPRTLQMFKYTEQPYTSESPSKGSE